MDRPLETPGALPGTARSALPARAGVAARLPRDPRLVQLLIPGSFTVLGQTILQFRITPLQLLVTWCVCCATELGLTYREQRRLILPLSATITALSLGLLLRTYDLLPFVIAGFAGIASKHVIRIEGRHVFNPSNFGLVLALVLFPDTAHPMIAEWGSSWGMLFVLLNCAFFIAYRVRRFHLAVAFLASYAVFAAATALGQGAAWTDLPADLANELTSGAILVFAFFMITDPKTSPTTTITRIIYGALTAALAFVLAAAGTESALFFALFLICPFVPQLDRLMDHCEWGRLRNRLALAVAALAVGTVGCVACYGASAATATTHLVSGGVGTARAATWQQSQNGIVAKLQQLGKVPHFTDVTAQSGLALVHHTSGSECPPPLGTGAAWADYDHTGRLDLYVTDHEGRSHLYYNNGDGTFTDVAVAAGVADPPRPTNGAVWADYDNDGWPDLLVLSDGHLTLYHNNRNGTFTDVTKHAGLASVTGRFMSAAWGDYDNDGYLDLFVTAYATCLDPVLALSTGAGGLKGLPAAHSYLFHNNGDGTFTNVTSLLGERQTSGYSYAAVWFDACGKGPAYPDLYVANDFGASIQPNVLWRNDGPVRGPDGRKTERFTDISGSSRTDMAAFAMSAVVGDYDNDGRLDLAVSNEGSTYLYKNTGGCVFRNVAARAGVARPTTPDGATSITWGLGFADLNNAGYEDLFLTAGPNGVPMGTVGMAMGAGNDPRDQPDVLFINNGNGTFTDASHAAGIDAAMNGRTVAFADYDNDGWLDMFVANYGQAPILYHNDSGLGYVDLNNHWLTVDLSGTRSNRDGVGAEISLWAHGLPVQLRQVQEGTSLGAGNAKEAHFGLGHATEADRIVVRWPSGAVQTLRHVAGDQRIVITEPGISHWP
jgi:Na+-translocating ferredoxin:NAD+ oxidoreductase RnfD subunit